MMPNDPKNYLTHMVTDRLEALALVLGFQEETNYIMSVYHELIDPWADLPAAKIRQKKSAFAADASPIELSVAITAGVPELRFSMEIIEEDTSIGGKRASAIAFVNKIEKLFNLDLSQYRAIEDLFLPENMQGKFAMFQSVRFSPGKPIVFDIHLNPKAAGIDKVNVLVQEALRRLGYAQGWLKMQEVLQRGDDLDQIFYFGIDVGEKNNRVKIYAYHKEAKLLDISRICQVAQNYVPHIQENFVREMTGGLELYSKWWLITTTAFVDINPIVPQTITTYVPMFAYAHDDAQAYERIHRYLHTHDLQPDIYRNLIDTFKNRDLSAGVGMQNWISLQRRLDQKLRWTIYLATELVEVLKPGTLPKVINQ